MKHLFRFMGVKKDSEWSILEEDLQHLLRVVRLKEGDEFELTDGCGAIAKAVITSSTKSKCNFDISSETFESRVQGEYEIYIGALKPSTLDDLIAPLVELGVSKIGFFGQKGSDKLRLSDKVIARTERLVVSALKQCKSAYKPEVCFYKSLSEAIGSSNYSNMKLLALLPEAKYKASEEILNSDSKSLMVFIGGEKGWDKDEIILLEQSGATPVSLGKNILRAWTAGVAAASLCSQLQPNKKL